MVNAASPYGRKRRRRLRLSALLVLPLIATGVGAAESTASASPVGVGPVPIKFDITDENGKWFDSGLNLLGSSSLAVAVLPRLGNTTPPTDVSGLLNIDLANTLLKAKPIASGGGLGLPVPGLSGGGSSEGLGLPLVGGAGGSGGGSSEGLGLPLIGGLGVDPLSSLNLDNLLQMVDVAGQSSEANKSKALQAKSLIQQFKLQSAGLPADVPLDLESLPVGVDLMKVLADLSETAEVGAPVQVNFKIDEPRAASIHTATSLIWPKGAKDFPVDQGGAWKGEEQYQLTEPGLYAWACKIHPYMLGAVVVDDPLTPGVDFGKELQVNSRGLSVPSNSDIIMQLVNKFFVITNPKNWQTFSNTEAKTWNPVFPPAPILTYNKDGKAELIPNLDSYFHRKFDLPKTLPALTQRPAVPGVGEVWIDTQKEMFAGKSKPGAATKVNVENWTVDRKVALPGINMNNPHNMWTDRNYQMIYQTEWFGDRLSVFDRKNGKFIRSIVVGPDPSHVMTRTDTDQLHVAINAGQDVVELSPGGTKIDRRIPTQSPDEKIAHPHAHWMSGDGKIMITPNVNSYDSTVVDIPSGTHRKEKTGELPIASGMMPDSSKYYMADFLGASVSCVSLAADACVDGGAKTHYKKIDLWANYDPVTGEKKGTWGGLPIQLPVQPDGKALLVANTLSSTVTVIDPKTDAIVKELPCDAGCHGINFGFKKGGGYYGYLSNKFSNAMQVIDTDPNNDGNIADAAVVGKMVLDPGPDTAMDDKIVEYAGFGGMGVLAIPLAYNGWSQQVPAEFRGRLTCRQLNPITPSAC